MKIAAAFLLLFGFIFQATAQSFTEPAPKLFRIVKQGKVGFINETGQTIIKPVFEAAGEFSEGLSPARQHGLYGYIDLKGNIIIAPQFEFAENFQEGIAITYQKGKPFYIDRTGKKLFPNPFSKIRNFHHGVAPVQTATQKQGIINKQGRLVVDTVFSFVHYLDNGTALVTGLNHKPFPIPYTAPKVFEVGLVDTLGKFLIPFGRYTNIELVENGYFLAQIPMKEESVSWHYALLNPQGQLIGSQKTNALQPPLYNHDSVVAVLKSKIPGFKSQQKPAVNQTSRKLEANTLFTSFYFISKTRLIAQDENHNFTLIDTAGKPIPTNTPFSFNPYFVKPGEPVLVRTKAGYGLMDSTGSFLIEPQFDYVDYISGFNSSNREDQHPDYFFYLKDQKMVRNPLWGIALKNGQLLTPPLFQEYDQAGFQNGLLLVAIDKRLTYVNRQGKIVWQEDKPNVKTKLNLDYRFFQTFRGDFQVKPASVKPKYSDVNYQHPVQQKNNLPENGLAVVAKPSQSAVFSKRYKGFPVFVANTTAQDISVKSDDYDLELAMQAQDSEGQWRDISYLQQSTCGNSHEAIILKQGNYWEFAAPVFEGSLKTTMRFSLKYIDPDAKTEKTIYSNEFKGKVNPGQFWQEKRPSGLADLPYLF